MKLLIDENSSGQRLDRYLRKRFKKASLREIYSLFRKKDIKVNGKREDISYRIKNGDLITIYLKDILKDKWESKDIIKSYSGGINIIYENNDDIVFFKANGLKTTPDYKGEDSLTTRVQEYLKQFITKTYAPSPVSRLDKDTSGLVLFSKTYKRMKYLQTDSNIRKKYLIIAKGILDDKIMHKSKISKSNDYKMVYDNKGKSIKTFFKPLQIYNNHSLIEAEIYTGRQHQIRYSLNELGLSCVGDRLYGERGDRLMLEAYLLSIDGVLIKHISDSFNSYIKEYGFLTL